MAQRVLTNRHWFMAAAALTFALALAACSPLADKARAAASACELETSLARLPLARLHQAKALVQRLERGTLYATLTQDYGAPRGCRVEANAQDLKVTASFAKGTSLELGGQEAIELAETRLLFRNIGESEAVALLKLAEHDQYGPEGCGIDWHSPIIEPADRAGSAPTLLFRGIACNCQGRLKRGLDAVLTLSSTC